ncbi:TonB-dependent receptor plug domain-containing protein [Hoylesella marshii]|uniref:TonB-dependent receptor plug domain protein n=1 Tax=Hoylesella marshii DSM 16973 = JCM 13450 TaxID=862515 RepID=E0NQ60_9BACT|nr:TonB-dependent receptor [Hoylesella marshii]EFM02753.1 TonB-dependent receptor plug domain protein [Hoylesella marshii DSM 16973 = JCM 13450]
MYKRKTNKRDVLLFKRFSHKGYALFACLGKEVLIGTLSVATLSYAKASGMSTERYIGDSIQQTNKREVRLDEVQVTGSRAPLTSIQAAKIVSVITREDIQRANAESVNDLLKLATGVDVRQRGGFGVQTDISINGGTFDQITILLNGMNISSPQTGHNAADFPVSLHDIERIEVLEGASARVFGSSAFSGAINIVTRSESRSSVQASFEGGSYGSAGGDFGLTLSSKQFHNKLSGGYMQTDGGTDKSDFKKRRAFYQGDFFSPYINLNWQAGITSQDYGANTFYSAKYKNQYEETRRYMGSLGATIHNLPAGIVVTPMIYGHRDYDHYQLIRGAVGASSGENYHQTDVYGASVNAYVDWLPGKTAIGADVRKERILSTAYGDLLATNRQRHIHGTERMYTRRGKRTNTSLFLEHDILLKQVTISAGLLANRNTALDGDFRLYPGVDISYRPAVSWKIYASWNKALRVPTYTDLYTNNPVQQGDITLKPEKNTTYKLGAQYGHHGIEAIASAFYSNGSNLIDWVKPTAASTKYQAINIGKLDNMGASADFIFRFPEILNRPEFFLTQARLSYAYIYQKHETQTPIYASLYALEYLRHKLTAEVSHRIWRHLSANWSLRWQQRMNGYHPYAKLDGKLMWNDAKYTLYVKADNITAHRYYDLGHVVQPGFWLMAGATIKLDL